MAGQGSPTRVAFLTLSVMDYTRDDVMRNVEAYIRRKPDHIDVQYPVRTANLDLYHSAVDTSKYVAAVFTFKDGSGKLCLLI